MKKSQLTNLTLSIFILMAFVLAMSAMLFNGILDKVAKELQISISETGLLSSAYAYGAAIGVPIILILFRKMERTKALEIMLFTTILATTWMILAPDFIQLLLARFLSGIAANSYGVLATATVADFSPKEKLGSALARLIMGSALAMVIGIPLTRFLSEIFSWRIDFAFLIFLMVLSLVYFIRYLPKAQPSEEEVDFCSELRFLKVKDVQFVLLSMFLFFFGYGGFYTFQTAYLIELTPSLFPLMSGLLVIFGLASFTGNHIGGVFADRIGYKKSLLIGSSLMAVLSMLIFILPKEPILLVLLIVLWQTAAWFTGIQMITGISVATDNKSSLMLSLNGSANQLGQAVGSSLAALVIPSLGISTIVFIPLAGSLIIHLFYILNRKQIQLSK